MKRYHWTGVIGLLIVIVFLLATALKLSNPTSESVHINVATIVTYSLWICFGIFLIVNYFKERELEEKGVIIPVPELSSIEDKEQLKIKRNRILGYVMIVEIISSVSSFILNDYLAGLTLINILVTFDLIINIIFVFVVVEIFRHKDVSKLLKYTVIIYTVGAVILGSLRSDWILIVSQILFGGYFIFALSAPLNRKNHRIAHKIILPAIIIIMVALGTYEAGRIMGMWKNQNKLDKEFANANTDAGTAYTAFIQSQNPNLVEIERIRDAMNRRNERLENLAVATIELREEYNKQSKSEQQQLALKNITIILSLIDLNRKQGNVLIEFMDYCEGIDLQNISEEEGTIIGGYMTGIESLNSEIRDTALKLDLKK
ncbi:MAG: hypothetical protein V4519_02495 [Patescibacteria group bacterium]